MKLYQVQNSPREKNVDAMFFCSLQVSNRFAKSASHEEQQLIEWLISSYDHRTLHDAHNLERVVAAIDSRVRVVNCQEEDTERILRIIVQPLTQEHSGYIRIERKGGRHQSLLLPFVDLKGAVSV